MKQKLPVYPELHSFLVENKGFNYRSLKHGGDEYLLGDPNRGSEFIQVIMYPPIGQLSDLIINNRANNRFIHRRGLTVDEAVEMVNKHLAEHGDLVETLGGIH